MMRLTVTCDALPDPESGLSECGYADEIAAPLGPVPPDSVGFAMLLQASGWRILNVENVGHAYVCPECVSRADAGQTITLALPDTGWQSSTAVTR
jgi:hypothetical protein